jgi:hypothetical protein
LTGALPEEDLPAPELRAIKQDLLVTAAAGWVDSGEAERMLDLCLSSARTRRLLESGLPLRTAKAGAELAASSREQARSPALAVAGLVSDWARSVGRLLRSDDRALAREQHVRLARAALAVSLLAGSEDDRGDGAMLPVGWLALHAIAVTNSPREMRALRLAPERRLAGDCEQARRLTAQGAWSCLAECAAAASARALVLTMHPGGYAE